jgi:hypothetical protein
MIFFKHKYITNPTVTPADAIITATANLSHVLMSNTAPTHLNESQLADLTHPQNHPSHTHHNTKNQSTTMSATGGTYQTYTPTPNRFRLRL